MFDYLIIHDYTARRIKEPVKYGFSNRINPNSMLTKLPIFLLELLKYINPSFIIVLKK